MLTFFSFLALFSVVALVAFRPVDAISAGLSLDRSALEAVETGQTGRSGYSVKTGEAGLTLVALQARETGKTRLTGRTADAGNALRSRATELAAIAFVAGRSAYQVFWNVSGLAFRTLGSGKTLLSSTTLEHKL